MKTIEIRAKSVEEALAQGLEQLGASLADVDYEVLDEGKKGLLGMIGSKPAVVRLTIREDNEEEPAIDEPSPKERAAKRNRIHKSDVKDKAEQVKAEVKEKVQAARSEKVEAELTGAPKAPKAVKAKPETEAAEAPLTDGPAAEAVPSKAEDFEADSSEYKALSFLGELTRLMGVSVDMYLTRDEEGSLRISMFGDTLGILIGRRGETLDAVQYLTSLYVNRGQENYTRVTLDTENYRAKREEALRRLANRMANRAVKTGRKVVMEPMNPYERRILHSALQQNDAVTTHSEGEEPNRHVVITLKNKN